MKGFGERKIWIVHTVLAITIVIGLVLASGCLNFLSPTGASKPGTQITPTLTGAPPPPTGGGTGGSGSTCDCDRHAFMNVATSSDINEPIDGVESRLAEQLTTSCFHLISHKTSIGGEPLKPTNPQPEEYYFNAQFVNNLGGKLNENGKEIKSRETVELYFTGNPEELIKTLTSESSDNLMQSHSYRMWLNEDAIINQIKPIDAFLKDYERMPVSGQITPSKDDVDTGETIDVTVDSLKDSQGRSPKPFQRILVKAENGKILGGTEAGEYKVFKAEDSSIKFQYKAPDSCDKATSDTITIYNSCDIADKVQPLTSTTPKNQIATKTINIKCEGGEGYIDYSCYFTTPRYFYYSEEWVKGTIPFTIEVVGKNYKWLTGNNTISYKKKIYWNPNEKDGCIWTYEGKTRALIRWDNDPEREEGKSGIWATYPPREDNGLFYGHYAYAEPGPIKQEMPACSLRNTLNDITDVSKPDLQTTCVQLGGYLISREWGTIPFQDGAEISRKDSIGIGEADTHIILHLKNKK